MQAVGDFELLQLPSHLLVGAHLYFYLFDLPRKHQSLSSTGTHLIWGKLIVNQRQEKNTDLSQVSRITESLNRRTGRKNDGVCHRFICFNKLGLITVLNRAEMPATVLRNWFDYLYFITGKKPYTGAQTD